jgi:hypothetical protein
MDDRALVYRGADQPDMSVINPESDVWQHIKVTRLIQKYHNATAHTYPRSPKVIWQQTGPSDIRHSAVMED